MAVLGVSHLPHVLDGARMEISVPSRKVKSILDGEGGASTSGEAAVGDFSPVSSSPHRGLGGNGPGGHHGGSGAEGGGLHDFSVWTTLRLSAAEGAGTPI